LPFKQNELHPHFSDDMFNNYNVYAEEALGCTYYFDSHLATLPLLALADMPTNLRHGNNPKVCRENAGS